MNKVWSTKWKICGFGCGKSVILKKKLKITVEIWFSVHFQLENKDGALLYLLMTPLLDCLLSVMTINIILLNRTWTMIYLNWNDCSINHNLRFISIILVKLSNMTTVIDTTDSCQNMSNVILAKENLNILQYSSF